MDFDFLTCSGNFSKQKYIDLIHGYNGYHAIYFWECFEAILHVDVLILIEKSYFQLTTDRFLKLLPIHEDNDQPLKPTPVHFSSLLKRNMILNSLE